MFKNILFDFDGTVFDSLEGIAKSVQYAMKKRGIDAELSELRCFAGPPLALMFNKRFGISGDDIDQAIADYRERYVPIGIYESSVFPGMKDLLTELKFKGFKLAIATSKPQHMAELLLSRENMTELFDVICGIKNEDIHGTKAQVLQRAMTLLGAEAKDSVLVGDTKYDVEGAKTCGVSCIGVAYGYAAEGELEQAGADYIAADIAELRKLLLD